MRESGPLDLWQLHVARHLNESVRDVRLELARADGRAWAWGHHGAHDRRGRGRCRKVGEWRVQNLSAAKVSLM